MNISLQTPNPKFQIITSSFTYDYIFSGGGCAALSLLVHLKAAGGLEGKRVLVLEKEEKASNDRTWCFWEKEPGLFEPVVHHQWDRLKVFGSGYEGDFDIAPYRYKLIRGIDFYRYCRAQLQDVPGLEWRRTEVQEVKAGADRAAVRAGSEWYEGRFVFNSVLFRKPELKRSEHWMLQHFRGWFLKTAAPQFDPGTATLMDFRTGQGEGTTFFYVLPFSRTEALVEYTLFSKNLLPVERYEAALRGYVEQGLGIRDYTVQEREQGVIPMTNYLFRPEEGALIHLGTAGGRTKGSSGYTFKFIQKHAAALTEKIVRTGDPRGVGSDSGRFHFYDSVLLHILSHDTLPGHLIFTELFRRNPPQRVLQFLDNETGLASELRLISTLPTLPFLKAAIRQF